MLDPNLIDTGYAKSGELNIAYQVFGSGDVYLKGVPGELHLFAASVS